MQLQLHSSKFTSKQFDKVFVIDTNIILNDVINLETLSEQSKNLIVMPEIVLDELDNKKSGFDVINYMAREFGRFLEKAQIEFIHKIKHENYEYTITRCFINTEKNITVDIISKDVYNCEKSTTSSNILNDRKILEIAQFTQETYSLPVQFISLDVMCRLRGMSLGLDSHSIGKNNDIDVVLDAEIDIVTLMNNPLIDINDFPESFTCEQLENCGYPTSVCGIKVINELNNMRIYYRSGTLFKQIDEEDLKKQNLKPLNVGQKVFSSLLLDEYWNIVVSNSAAGTGKSAIALSAAMRLIDTTRDKYTKIVYIRDTVISSENELGFLPGDLKDKMSGYMTPLNSTLEAIVKNKYNNSKKRMRAEEIEEKITEMVEKYQIETPYIGFLRGTNIRDAIIIIDEFQNNTLSSARTIISRIAENCKLICIGSTKQIDSKFVNAKNNALTYLLNRVSKDNQGVTIAGYNLEKTVRSAMAEFGDNIR